jgi:hypothetical protein
MTPSHESADPSVVAGKMALLPIKKPDGTTHNDIREK